MKYDLLSIVVLAEKLPVMANPLPAHDTLSR
jgi:hypothetical protein